MIDIEQMAHEYIRATQDPDSRKLKTFMRGMDDVSREEIYNQLKEWDVVDYVPIKLLRRGR